MYFRDKMFMCSSEYYSSATDTIRNVHGENFTHTDQYCTNCEQGKIVTILLLDAIMQEIGSKLHYGLQNISYHGPLARYVKLWVAHAPGTLFPHYRGLAIQTCITARAWRTSRDACRGR